eukprot:1921751-Rhodomonas_salina.1
MASMFSLMPSYLKIIFIHTLKIRRLCGASIAFDSPTVERPVVGSVVLPPQRHCTTSSSYRMAFAAAL